MHSLRAIGSLAKACGGGGKKKKKNIEQAQHARASLHNREGNVETARAVEWRYGSVCLGLGIGHKNKHGCP